MNKKQAFKGDWKPMKDKILLLSLQMLILIEAFFLGTEISKITSPVSEITDKLLSKYF